MANKPSRTVDEQLLLLESRGMKFRDKEVAREWLRRISYYRLKGYWWGMQDDVVNHHFRDGSWFEDVIKRYEFDKELKVVLFRAIESLEIALRTKLIYHMSQDYGSLWYMNPAVVHNGRLHQDHLLHLQDEFKMSGEVFVKDFLQKHPNQLARTQRGYQSDQDPDAWIIMEVATLGELSKWYKNIAHQLPAKSRIANEFGFNLHSELSSWLESMAYIRNIIAHHSRLWGRNMVKRPSMLQTAPNPWLGRPLVQVEEKRAFHLISALLYMCDAVGLGDRLRMDIYRLMWKYRDLPVHGLGFFNDWQTHPVWRMSRMKKWWCWFELQISPQTFVSQV